jgi:hypothetical protein
VISRNGVTLAEVLGSYRSEPRVQRYLPFLEQDIVPFNVFHVYRDWLRLRDKDPRIDVLFIGESPPWRGIEHLPDGDLADYRYFYNNACRAPAALRTTILSRLDVTRTLPDALRLAAFRDHHLFLTDALKCAFRKDLHSSIPEALVRVGAHLLQEEILWLSPRYIVAMGSTAFTAVREIWPEHLREYRRISEVPETLIDGRILVMPYPNTRNRGMFGKRLDAAFSHINALIERAGVKNG